MTADTAPVARDRNGLEVLTRRECLDHLREATIGRIGLSWDALPVVLPVNYVFDGGEIVFRTAAGTKLGAALVRTVVAFEVDDYDGTAHTGWSVLVRGTTRLVSSSAELAEMRRLPLRPWANDSADLFVAIEPELVSGRRIRGWYEVPGGVGPHTDGDGDGKGER